MHKNLDYVHSIDPLYNDLQSIKRMLLGLIKSKQLVKTVKMQYVLPTYHSPFAIHIKQKRNF